MGKVKFERDTSLESLVARIVEVLGLEYIDPSRVRVVRSRGARTRAYARIYGLPRPFTEAYDFKPCYVVEVVSENFDPLPFKEKVRILIHELLHIPKTFSGALRPHRWNRSLEAKLTRKVLAALKPREATQGDSPHA